MYFCLLIIKQYVPSTVLIIYIYEVITYKPFERSLSADQEQAALCSLPADKLGIPGSDRPTRSTMNDSKYLATCVRLFWIQIRKDDGPGWNAGKKWGKGENLVEWGGADRTKDVFSVVLLLCFYKNVGSTVPSSMLLTHRSQCLRVVRSVLLCLTLSIFNQHSSDCGDEGN